MKPFLMKRPWNHLSVLLLLQLVVFVTYWRVTALPLWNPLDFGLLYDAHVMSANLDTFFTHIGTLFSQPLLRLVLMYEYHLFGIEPAGYLTINIALHGLNSFIVYLLVYMLFPRERLANLASLLFALSVGHYGKLLMSISGVESLMLSFFYLMVLYALIRNDFHYGGRVWSGWYLFGLAVYVLAGLTGAMSFSILGGLVAYRFFFYKERGGRAVFPPSLMILVVVGSLIFAAQHIWGYQSPDTTATEPLGPLHAVWFSFKTIFRYLNLIVFPLQESSMLSSSHPLIQLIYDWRVVVRSLVALGVISFSFFGLVFGGRSVRFFIAWTYITVLPFTVIATTGSWLNIQYLYMASIGFCVILAGGTVGCMGLLASQRWKRLAPLAAPLLFVLISQTVVVRLTARNTLHAEGSRAQELHRVLEQQIEGYEPQSTISPDLPSN